MSNGYKPLEGVRVVELSFMMAGPSCGRHLADWGAEVIKVETMHGDPYRHIGPTMGMPITEKANPNFDEQNAFKNFMALNLRTPEGMEILHKLLATADVFLSNNRAKALEAMGLSWETLHAKYPRLVYAQVYGYGERGPMKDVAGFVYMPDAMIGYVGAPPEPDGIGTIVVATGGTSDIPVAEEAALTAEFYGNRVLRLYDVGVSGVHRLFSRLDDIMSASVIIAIAGMEGALASVIGGLADCPVIAVPTSVGYGASFSGLSALLSMLNSCASGVSVVNIDNGFGAGYVANMINHMEVRK